MLPPSIRQVILSGTSQWRFRARLVRCCFEYAEVSACTPRDALLKARALPVKERVRRFMTIGEDAYLLEVFFDGGWHRVEDVPADDAQREFERLVSARARVPAPADAPAP